MGEPDVSRGVESLTLVEAYVESLASAREAEAAGADRLELCGPGEGGLTPSRALLASVLVESRLETELTMRTVSTRARLRTYDPGGAEEP